MQNNTLEDRIVFVLSELLQERNISMYKLAKDTGVTRTRIVLYCKNRVQRPDLALLARICRALDCEVGDILRYIPGEATEQKSN